MYPPDQPQPNSSIPSKRLDWGQLSIKLDIPSLSLQPRPGMHLILRTLLFQVTWFPTGVSPRDITPRDITLRGITHGSIVWQSPLDVQVHTAQGRQHLWIIDWTRLAIIAIGLWTFFQIGRIRTS